jgi:hypothetical protein
MGTTCAALAAARGLFNVQIPCTIQLSDRPSFN